jgi:hypothetical protein
MKKFRIPLLLVALLVIAGGIFYGAPKKDDPGTSAPTTWPAVEQAKFMRDCARNPSDPVSRCSCYLRVFEEQYTLDEYNRMEERVGPGFAQLPLSVDQALGQCDPPSTKVTTR